jgi:hypothetical protein
MTEPVGQMSQLQGTGKREDLIFTFFPLFTFYFSLCTSHIALFIFPR